MLQICHRCQSAKPLSEFYSKPTAKNNFRVFCITCVGLSPKQFKNKQKYKITPKSNQRMLLSWNEICESQQLLIVDFQKELVLPMQSLYKDKQKIILVPLTSDKRLLLYKEDIQNGRYAIFNA